LILSKINIFFPQYLICQTPTSLLLTLRAFWRKKKKTTNLKITTFPLFIKSTMLCLMTSSKDTSVSSAAGH